jgi:hypothetical protein
MNVTVVPVLVRVILVMIAIGAQMIPAMKVQLTAPMPVMLFQLSIPAVAMLHVHRRTSV